jgi:hypothetical protein
MAFCPCWRKSRRSAQITSSLSALREPRVRPAGFPKSTFSFCKSGPPGGLHCLLPVRVQEHTRRRSRPGTDKFTMVGSERQRGRKSLILLAVPFITMQRRVVSCTVARPPAARMTGRLSPLASVAPRARRFRATCRSALKWNRESFRNQYRANIAVVCFQRSASPPVIAGWSFFGPRRA